MRLVGFKAQNHEQQVSSRGALDAVDEGRFRTGTPNGNIVCRMNLTNPGLIPGCLPWNPFGNGSPSAAYM